MDREHFSPIPFSFLEAGGPPAPTCISMLPCFREVKAKAQAEMTVCEAGNLASSADIFRSPGLNQG